MGTFRSALLGMVFCTSLSGCMHRAGLQAYAGRWVLQSSGKNMMVLTMEARHGRITGTLVEPKHHTEDANGEFTGISLPIVTLPVVGRRQKRVVELTVGYKPDWDRMPMTLSDGNHALVGFYRGQVPDWIFERVMTMQEVAVATDWPAYDLDPEIVAIRQQLRDMAEEDKAVREKQRIDPSQTEDISARDRPFLEMVFVRYGWPKISVFDVRASNDFWLLVQHQPLSLQERMLAAMKTAIDTGEASKRNYAYLFDSVQDGEGKPQYWGTQSKCEHGRAILSPVDDMTHIEDRRRDVGLDSLAESLKASDIICGRVH